MKHCFAAILTVLVHLSYSQIFICKDGITKFTSEAPLEIIKAKTNKTSGVIDGSTKNVAFSINVETFDGFNSGLQKEHFKENYLETKKYPTGTFKGKIIEDIDFKKPGTYMVRVKGIFNIHGIDKEKILKGKIVVKDNEITIEATFEIPLEEHDIKIPKIVNQKIASIIRVDVTATLKPKA